jgi:tetratricopeptide (TPR) repeat protein
MCVISGQFAGILEIAPDLIASIEKAGRKRESFGTEHNVYSFLNALYGWSMGWCGNFPQGEAFLARGLRYASKTSHITNLGVIELIFGLFYNAKGEGELAVKHTQNAIRYIEESKYVHVLGAAWTALGWGCHLLGRQEQARTHIEQGMRVQLDAGIPYHLSRSYLVLGMVHFASGDLNSARISSKKAIELSRDCGERHFEGISRVWLGRILGKENGSREGAEHIYAGMKILDELRLKPFSAQGHLFLGMIHVNNGQREKALKNFEKANDMFREMEMNHWVNKTRAGLESL